MPYKSCLKNDLYTPPLSPKKFSKIFTKTPIWFMKFNLVTSSPITYEMEQPGLSDTGSSCQSYKSTILPSNWSKSCLRQSSFPGEVTPIFLLKYVHPKGQKITQFPQSHVILGKNPHPYINAQNVTFQKVSIPTITREIFEKMSFWYLKGCHFWTELHRAREKF